MARTQAKFSAFNKYSSRDLGKALIAAMEVFVAEPRSHLVSRCELHGGFSPASIGSAACSIVAEAVRQPVPPQLPASDMILFSHLAMISIKCCRSLLEGLGDETQIAVSSEAAKTPLHPSAAACMSSPVHEELGVILNDYPSHVDSVGDEARSATYRNMRMIDYVCAATVSKLTRTSLQAIQDLLGDRYFELQLPDRLGRFHF